MVYSVGLLCAFSLFLLLFFSTFITVNLGKPPNNDVLKGTKLIMFSSVFRHGNRTPEASEIAVFPNSAYDQSIYFPSGLGQLTNGGRARAYASGQYLRRRYNGLLSPLYLVDQIRMRTTDYDRTKMTGMLVYAGLYPPQKLQRWNPALDWQPIPFDTPPSADDSFMAFNSCPQYQALFTAQNSNPNVVEVFNSYSDVITKLSAYSGQEITGLLQVFSLYQVLLAQAGVGRTIPDWAVRLLPKIREINDIGFSLLFYGSEELITLSGGPLLNEMLTNMEAAAESGTPTRRAYLYSAHDLTVGGVMSAAGIYDKHEPAYSSMFTLELRKKDSTGEFGVVALYTRDPEEEPEILLVPGCPQVFCPLDTFAVVASKYAITEDEFNQLCVVES